MKRSDSQITVYFNPESSSGKKALAYAHSVSNYIYEIEYAKANLTATGWKQLLVKLQLEPKQLLNKSHPYYQKHIRGRSFDEEGWLSILMRNPDLIAGPIVVQGKKAVLCSNPTDVYRLLQNVQVQAQAERGA